MNYYRKTVGFLASSRIGRVMMLGIVAMLAYSLLADAANQRRGAKVKSIVVESAVPTLTVGNAYQGGIIAYIDETGQHGLIAATDDQGEAKWSNVTTTEIGTTAQGTAIGTGASNTTAIINQTGHNASAAKVCADYSVDVDGTTYDDWYLPSKDELNQLYHNLYKEGVGGFGANFCWSSSECGATNAWNQNFYNGSQGNYSKNYSNRVRPVRAF